MGQDEFGVVIIHRERTGYNHLARQIACLTQHIVDSRPVHGEQYRVRFLRGLSRCAGPRLALGLPCEPLELLFAAGVAEYHLMSGSREKRPEFAAHQPGTQNANSHAAPPSPFAASIYLARLPSLSELRNATREHILPLSDRSFAPGFRGTEPLAP